MISKTVNYFCNEDLSLIENYNKAINDETQTWDCHHRLETELNLTKKQLIEKDLYYCRPASELIFLTKHEHTKLHKKGISLSDEHKLRIKQNANHLDTYDKHGENNPKSKNVLVIDIETNNIIKTIKCGKYAAEELGLNYSTFKKYINKNPIQKDNLIYIYETDFKKNIYM